MTHSVQVVKRKMQVPCSQVIKNFKAVVAEQTLGAGPLEVRGLGRAQVAGSQHLGLEQRGESLPGSSPAGLPRSLESPAAGPTPYSAGRLRHLAAHWRAAAAAHIQLVRLWCAVGVLKRHTCRIRLNTSSPLRHHNSLSFSPSTHLFSVSFISEGL